MSDLPVGILLAAGNSSRFGSNKLLHPIQNNTPMLMLAAKKLASVLPKSIVVINPELKSYAPQLEQLGLRVVVNEQAQQGMGSSIACGVRASASASGWLIALADMPYIRSETIALLAAKLQTGAAIVAPVLNQQRGHPVGFDQRYKEELMALHDDVGARHVVARHQTQLELIPVEDAGVVKDIDQISDIAGMCNQNERM
jgi:molybdenum cofactor cytidylyltransferase